MARFSTTTKVLWYALALIATAMGRATAVDLWQAGVDGISWRSIGTLDGLTTQSDTLQPAAVDPATNALANLNSRGGEISSPQESRENLTALLTDDNLDTSWRVTRERRPDGTSMVIDLGAILPINRIRVVGDEDVFLRAYELFVHDGNPSSLRNDRPIAYTNLVRTNLEQDDPIINVEIPLQFVRFIRLISRSTQEFTISEAEVFGDGFAPTGEFVSQVIDLGEPANFGHIQLPVQLDSLTNVVLQTRSGIVSDPLVYYKKTDVFEGEDRSQEPLLPVGSPDAAEAYDDLVNADKGDILDNVDEWSPWSAPYEDFNGDFLSPGNRRYVQFRLVFSSQDARLGAGVEGFAFEHSTPALSTVALSEIDPPTVILGQRQVFNYYIRSNFDPGNPGFDQIEIRTPFKADLQGVEIDGVAVDFAEVDQDNERSLTVQLTQDRVATSGQVVRVTFESLVTVYGTTFFGKIFNSLSEELGQDVVPGDATPLSDSDQLAVQGELRDQLLQDFAVLTPVFTPNGDQVNDELVVEYILLRALNPVPVDLTLYDLAGTPIARIQDSKEVNGPQRVGWDGRDEQGNLVPPGVYLLGLTADSDTGVETRTRVVGVAY
ncbi:MAG: hypothetical protein GKR89_05580 [Candidatus Latescibacteria bacterium]|nr:hypothetical protein [Candidatus Latescibacterota bacterium]